MRKGFTSFLCLLIGGFVHQLRAQTGTDVCMAMVTDAAHSISLRTDQSAYYVSLFKNYCNADGSTNDSAINVAASAVIKAVPVSITGGSTDSHKQWEQFCKTETSVAAGSSESFDYESLVVAEALSSANQCLKILSDHAYTLTYKGMTADTMFLNFGIPSGQTIAIHGVSTDPSVSCTGTDFTKGGSFAYRQGVGQTIDASKGGTAIKCVRTPFATIAGSPHYKEAAIEVDTNVGWLNIFWPKESVLPLTDASKIQQAIASLQASVNFNALPIGTILPWYQKNGTLPAGWAKCDGSDTGNCPDLRGLFLRGSGPGDVGSTGGSPTTLVPQHGSNNSHGDGNGWNKGGSNWISNDQVNVPIIPPFTSVLYIKKISNK
jgi:hypothetical protein